MAIVLNKLKAYSDYKINWTGPKSQADIITDNLENYLIMF